MKQQGARRRVRGQALVEYAMTVLLIIGLFAFIDNRIRSGIGHMWKALATEVAAGCPGCEAPDQLR